MNSLLSLRETHFVLWRPRMQAPPPTLIIGRFQWGNPPVLVDEQSFELSPSQEHPDLWLLPLTELGLAEGVYHYWFEVNNSNVYKQVPGRIRVTDPFATSVDWRLLPQDPDGLLHDGDYDAAAVIKVKGERLVPCDPGGEEITRLDGEDWSASLPANNRLVIYELPASWARPGERGGAQMDVGTFRDVEALVDADAEPHNFFGLGPLHGRAHLTELGVNALELLPPADSWVNRQWGYATSNYTAPDYDLGYPHGHSWPTALTDFARLVDRCHDNGIRVFADMAMGFANHCSWENINFLDFHIQETDDPNAVDPEKDGRQNWGGQLFKYNYWTHAYDPVTGTSRSLVPARQYMLTQAEHWIRYLRVDGIRMDSIKTVHNWDFVQSFNDHSRSVWRAEVGNHGLTGTEADQRFLVVGEVLDHQEEKELIRQRRLDGIWNERFKEFLRHAVLGTAYDDEPDFGWMVRKMVDGRMLGYSDGSQMVNYITSHDVEGYRNERLYDFFLANGVNETDAQRRIKLAFVCLLTSVGIPMIFAGEEFAEQHDLAVLHPHKQVDAVNFSRVDESWRRNIFDYVAKLVHLRTQARALSVNDTDFIHQDFSDGKRVMAWRRGGSFAGDQIVVVANFSDWGTHNPLTSGAEYVVNNWPPLPSGKQWRELTQDRDVPEHMAGREALFPWEAKVYMMS